MTVKSEIKSLQLKDKRKTFTDFLETFDLNLLFSDSNALKTLDTVKNPELKVYIEKALVLYKNDTKEYPTASKMRSFIKEKADNLMIKREKYIDIRDVEKSTGLHHLMIENAMTAKNNSNLEDIYDVFDLDLIDNESIFNNLLSYKAIKKLIMQTQMIAKGNKRISKEHIAKSLKVQKNKIIHPELLCRSTTEYIKVYIGLNKLKQQLINQMSSISINKIRSEATIGDLSIRVKLLEQSLSIKTDKITILDEYNNKNSKYVDGLMIEREDIPIYLDNAKERRNFFKKRTAKSSSLTKLFFKRKEMNLKVHNINVPWSILRKLEEMIKFEHSTKTLFMHYLISNVDHKKNYYNQTLKKRYKLERETGQLLISLPNKEWNFLRKKSKLWKGDKMNENGIRYFISYIVDTTYSQFEEYRKENKYK